MLLAIRAKCLVPLLVVDYDVFGFALVVVVGSLKGLWIFASFTTINSSLDVVRKISEKNGLYSLIILLHLFNCCYCEFIHRLFIETLTRNRTENYDDCHLGT
ncbi:hypothetical protein Tco_0815863 [Tanacetum coccineum]